MVDTIILSVEVSKAVGNGEDEDEDITYGKLSVLGKLLVLNESRCTFPFMCVDFCDKEYANVE